MGFLALTEAEPRQGLPKPSIGTFGSSCFSLLQVTSHMKHYSWLPASHGLCSCYRHDIQESIPLLPMSWTRDMGTSDPETQSSDHSHRLLGKYFNLGFPALSSQIKPVSPAALSRMILWESPKPGLSLSFSCCLFPGQSLPLWR